MIRIQHIRYAPGKAGESGTSSATPVALGPFGKALAIAGGAVVLVAGLFVSVIVFATLLVVGAIAGGWLWWRTRGLRAELRERIARMQAGLDPRAASGAARPGAASGDVIDGDYVQEVPPEGAPAGGAAGQGEVR